MTATSAILPMSEWIEVSLFIFVAASELCALFRGSLAGLSWLFLGGVDLLRLLLV